MKPAQGVGVGIGIAVLIFVLIMGLNVYAISNLQFRAQSIDNFSIFPDLKMNMNMETCNPTFFPASYKAIYLDVYYKQSNLGTATMYGSMIPPGTSVPTKGDVDLHSGSVLGSIIDAIGSALTGSTPSTNDVKFKIKLDAPVLGVIPFTIEKHYSYDEFSKMLEGGNNYGCSIQNPIPNFGIIESQFENEINSLESALNDAKQQLESTQKSIEEVTETVKEQIEETIEPVEPVEEPVETNSMFGDLLVQKEPAREPLLLPITTTPISPEPGDFIKIKGTMLNCPVNPGNIELTIYHPDGSIFEKKTIQLSYENFCKYEATMKVPNYNSEGQWKLKSKMGSVEGTGSFFILRDFN